MSLTHFMFSGSGDAADTFRRVLFRSARLQGGNGKGTHMEVQEAQDHERRKACFPAEWGKKVWNCGKLVWGPPPSFAEAVPLTPHSMRPGSAGSNIRCPLRQKGQVLSARRAGHDLDGWLIDCINRAVSHHRLAHGNGFIPDGLVFAGLTQPNESGQKQVLAYSVRRRSRCGFPGQFSEIGRAHV